MPISLPRWLPVAVAFAAAAHAQPPAPLSPATQAAVDARHAELARQAKAETDAAIAKRNAGAMPDKLRMTVGAVNEQRTSNGAGTLNIQLLLFLEDIPPNAIFRGQKILSAVDNLGQPVVPSANVNPNVILGAGGAARGRAAAPTNARTLSFQVPSRKAESIKSIDGEIEFLLPNDNATVKVPALASLAGKVIESPALARNEIEITYLTKEMYDSLKATWGTSAAATGAANFGSSAFFLVKDPKSRLVSLELQDATGGVLQRNTSTRNTNALGVSVIEAQIGPAAGGISMAQIATMQAAGQNVPPAVIAQAQAAAARGPAGGPLVPEGAQLSVVVAAPESVKTYPFHLENIALP